MDSNHWVCKRLSLQFSQFSSVDATVSVQRWASSSPAWLLITFLNIQVLKEQILLKKRCGAQMKENESFQHWRGYGRRMANLRPAWTTE